MWTVYCERLLIHGSCASHWGSLTERFFSLLCGRAVPMNFPARPCQQPSDSYCGEFFLCLAGRSRHHIVRRRWALLPPCHAGTASTTVPAHQAGRNASGHLVFLTQVPAFQQSRGRATPRNSGITSVRRIPDQPSLQGIAGVVSTTLLTGGINAACVGAKRLQAISISSASCRCSP